MAASYLQHLLPELVFELVDYLDCQGIGDLRLSCRRLDVLLTPYFRRKFFYRDLDFWIADETSMSTLEQISASPIYRRGSMRPKSLNLNMARLETEAQWERVLVENEKYEMLQHISGRPQELQPITTVEPDAVLKKRAFTQEVEDQEWFVFGGGLATKLRRIFRNFLSSGILLNLSTMTCTTPEWHQTRGLARIKRLCGMNCLDRSDSQQDVYEILVQALIDTGYPVEGLSLGSQWESKVSLEMFGLLSPSDTFVGLRTFSLQILPRFYKPYDDDEDLKRTAMCHLGALARFLRGLRKLESLSLNMSFLGSNVAADQRLQGVRPLEHLLKSCDGLSEPQFPELRHLSLARDLLGKEMLLTFLGNHAPKLQSLDLVAIEDLEQTHPDFADELYAVVPSKNFALHMYFVYGCLPLEDQVWRRRSESPLEERISHAVASQLT